MEFVFKFGGSGSPLVKITITDNLDGSFTFELEQIGSGAGGAFVAGDLKGELRGLFFDVDGNVDLASSDLTIDSIDAGTGDASTLAKAVTTGDSGENDVTGFTEKGFTDVNMLGEGLPTDGGYDVGVAFGSKDTSSIGDDVQGITFTLTGFDGFTVDDFAGMDFGVRLTSVGTVDGSGNFTDTREGSSKILGTSNDVAVSFAVTVASEDPLLPVPDASATIVEQVGGDDTATFTIAKSGGTLTGDNTASVTLTMSGTAVDADFTAAVIAAVATAATTAGIAVSAQDGDSLVLTWAAGDPDSFNVALTAFNDDLFDSGDALTLTLSDQVIDEGTASITTAAATATILDNDVAVTFGITVTSEMIGDDTPTQLAVISEEGTADNMGTFTITQGGGTLAGSNTASVTVTMSGTATDADFTAAVIATIASAATLAGIGVSAQDGDSLVLTWGALDPTSLNVDLTAFDDTLVKGLRTLTLTLSDPTVVEGSATLVGDETAANLTMDDFEARILNGTMITNSNQTNQFVTLTFEEVVNPLHSAAKMYDLNLQGQQGSVVQDVGFLINPAKLYDLTVEASSGTKAIITDLTLEGVVIQGSGNVQLEKNNTSSTASDSTAITAIINPDDPIVQAKTESTDGSGVANTLTDAGGGIFNYLFGADGNDTLNGSADSDVLNGGGGLDTLNGNNGNDILVFDNVNNDAISGGAGTDLLRIDDGALALSLAGSSSNTNTLGPGNNVLVDITGKNITGIEGVLITEEAGTSTTATDPNDDVGTTVKLNALDVWNYSDTDTLHILGSPGDVLELDTDDGWSAGALQATDSQGQAFVLYTATVGFDTVSLFVETDVSVDFIL